MLDLENWTIIIIQVQVSQWRQPTGLKAKKQRTRTVINVGTPLRSDQHARFYFTRVCYSKAGSWWGFCLPPPPPPPPPPVSGVAEFSLVFRLIIIKLMFSPPLPWLIGVVDSTAAYPIVWITLFFVSAFPYSRNRHQNMEKEKFTETWFLCGYAPFLLLGGVVETVDNNLAMRGYSHHELNSITSEVFLCRPCRDKRMPVKGYPF